MPITIRTPGNRTSLIDAYSADGPLVNTGLECTPAILAAIAATGVAELLRGEYTIDPSLTSLLLTAGGVLRGCGRQATTLHMLAGETGIGVRLGSNSAIEDLRILGNSEASTTGAAPLSGDETTNIRCSRVTFENLGAYGFASNGKWIGARLIDCDFLNNAIDVRTNHACELTDILYCNFVGTGAHVELQANPVGGLVLGCNFSGGTNGVQLSSARRFYAAGNRFSGVTTPIQSGGRRNDIGPNYNASAEFDGPSLVLNTLNSFLGHFYRSSAPNAGAWQQGDFVHNRSMGTSEATPIGWQCTTAGDFDATPPVFQEVYRGRPRLIATIAWNPAEMADGAGTSKSDFAVTGAALGNRVAVAAPYELPAGVFLTASVVTTNTVRVSLFNHSGAPVDLGSGDWTIEVTQ